MNEISAAQERYIGFVNDLVNEALNRVERVLGIDVVTAAPITLEEIVPAAVAAVTTKALEAVKALPAKRTYKKRSDRPRRSSSTRSAKSPAPGSTTKDGQGQISDRADHAPGRGLRQAEAHSEKPASPPTSSPKPQTGIGIKPLEPAVAAMRECPCVNPTKDDCEKIAPVGIHTRGTGAAAQYSRCRFYDVRMAVDNRRRGRFKGPSVGSSATPPAAPGKGRRYCPGCGGLMGGPYTHCKACRAKRAA